MKSQKLILKAAAALAIVFGLSLTVQAQIGSGWTSYSPSYTTQLEGCGTNSGLVFQLTCSTTHAQNSAYQRAERRYADVNSGYSQFQGSVTVNSLSGDDICLKQTFQDGGATGPFNMIAVSKASNDLYEVEGNTGVPGTPKLASYTVGSSIRINTITNTSGKSVQVYINGSLVETKTNALVPLYDKFGTYRTVSGYGPIKATWSSVQFWKHS